jgi:hypothetical protein
MGDTNPFTTKQCLVSIWVHENGQMYDEIANFALHFNKAAPTEANLRKLEKETFVTGSVLKCDTQWKTTEICGCQCSFGGVGSLLAQKIHEEMIYRIPDSKKLHAIFGEQGRLS